MMIDAALQYAADGMYVFPVHSVRDGRCTCANAACSSPGKHPRTAHGLTEATRDAKTIRAWWRRWPDANIGIATGPSRLCVIDVDLRDGGLDRWMELTKEHGIELCDTYRVRTGGGGLHFYFRVPDGMTIPSSAGRIAPGIDVRAAGGYVIAPPSVHVSGGRYRVEGQEMDDEAAA